VQKVLNLRMKTTTFPVKEKGGATSLSRERARVPGLVLFVLGAPTS